MPIEGPFPSRRPAPPRKSSIQSTPPAGRCLLACENPVVRLPMLMGTDLPTITSGFGGWSSQTRPQRRSFLKWDGPDVFRMTLNVILDGWNVNESVQPQLDSLFSMAKPLRDGSPSPYVSVYGAALPMTGQFWVIDELELGDSICNKDGALLRQILTITVAKQSQSPSVTIARRSKSKSTGQSTYVWARGDTIQKVAQKKLGDAKRWKEILTLNKIRDWHTIKIGTTLRIPAK